MAWPDVPPTYYQGRLWDAPFTDGAIQRDLTGQDCVLCGEPILETDDAVYLPYIHGHLECHLRSGMGDVQHLEGRCLCGGGSEVTYPSDVYSSYRESAKATLKWLIDHQRGRFHE